MNWRNVVFCVLMVMTLACVGPFIPKVPILYKGLVIHPDYLSLMSSGARLPRPSFSELALARFNFIGTIAYSSNGPNEWELIRKWIFSAHAAGFKVFIDLWGNEHDPSSVTRDVQQTVKIGADVVFLDEILSIYEMDQTTFDGIINAGRSLNPNLQYYVNEWSPDYIRRAYEWTTSYPYVRVAEDNYDDKSVIDLNIQLGAQYGKVPAVWLIFAKGSKDFDCYRNLDDWIAYVEQRQISTFFWFIDPAGTWTEQWSSAVAFDPRAYA